MNDGAFQSLIKKQIIECRWSYISARWLDYIQPIDPPGSAPDFGVSELVGFKSVASSIKDIDKPVKSEVAGLRDYVFREAVYLMHKAFHVSGCAENQIKRGYKTWSVADAYQASLFGAKAILYFCGIVLADFESKAFLIDVFPKEEDTHKRRKQKLTLPLDRSIQFTKLNMKFEHRHVWMIFQRLLNVFTVDVWQESYVQALRRLEIKEFAKQRNELNYKNEVWIFEDLHDFVIDPTFGEHPTDLEDSLNYSLESDFSLCLSLTILRMCFALFENICESTNILNPEIQILRNKFSTTAYNPLYLVAHP